MELLLDSHALYRWDNELHLLSRAQRAALANQKNTIFVSAASAWELGIKRAKGKLRMETPVHSLIERYSFVELAVTVAHAEYAAGLPMLHKDPFDRLLAAQAMLEGLTLVTVDPMMARYGAAVLV